MANHLTPEELAKEVGTDEGEIVRVCVTEGIPIYHGRVDKFLFGTHIETHGITLRSPVTLNA